MSLYEDRSGVIWIGTFGEGICRLNNREKIIQHYYSKSDNDNSLSNKVYSFCEDRFENLWVGTADSGLNKFDRKKNKIIRFRHDDKDKNSLSYDRILSILEDKKGKYMGRFDRTQINLFREK